MLVLGVKIPYSNSKRKKEDGQLKEVPSDENKH